LDPRQARGELARRQLARRHLLDFARYVAPWYRPARVHEAIAGALERVARFIETEGREGVGRLMVFMPPRHGKTALVSQFFPAWLLGRMPDAKVILASYAADLAVANSRAVRGLLSDGRYAPIFGALAAVDAPVSLSEESRSAGAWELARPHRGGLTAAGVGGGITGKGAHLLVIDDPFKNREEAESASRRELVWRWYTSSAYTRLEPGGAIVVVHTRWHQDDLAGRLLKQMALEPLADRWEVISLPALPEAGLYVGDAGQRRAALLEGLWVDAEDPLGRGEGEALWPERYGAEALRRVRATVGDYDWFALYQQQPRPLGGAFFRREWFRLARPQDAPRGVMWARYWDLAVSEREGADYTASVAAAMGEDGTVYYRDMVRGRWSWPATRQRMLAQNEIDPPEVVWGVEDTAFQLAAFQELMREPALAGRAIWRVSVREMGGDKRTRALPLQARAAQGRVALVMGPWVEAFLAEAAAFPKGAHDDQVDAAAGALWMLSRRAMRRASAGHVDWYGGGAWGGARRPEARPDDEVEEMLRRYERETIAF